MGRGLRSARKGLKYPRCPRLKLTLGLYKLIANKGLGKHTNRAPESSGALLKPFVVYLAKLLFAFVGFFEFAYIQFFHTKHNRANPISFGSIWITHHDVQAFWHNLPR